VVVVASLVKGVHAPPYDAFQPFFFFLSSEAQQ